jgi:hypothetical protein
MFVARISTAIQKRNAAIFFANATPLRSGILPLPNTDHNADTGRNFNR